MKWNLSDDELEKIFKQGTEDAKFDYDPAAWTQMESLLDKEKKKKRGLYLFKFIYLLGIVAIVLSFWLFSLNKSDQNEKANSNKINQSVKERTPLGKVELANINARDSAQLKSEIQSKIESKEVLNKANKNDKPESTKGLINLSKTGIQKAQNQLNLSTPFQKTYLDNHKYESSISHGNTTVQESAFQEIKIEKSAPIEGKNSTTSPVDIGINIPDEKNRNPTVESTTTIANRIYEIIMPMPSRVTQLIWTDKIPLRLLPLNPKLEIIYPSTSRPLLIAMSIGKRYTSTPATKFGNGDNNYGFGLGYGLNRRLAFLINGSYTSDTYQAGYEDYNPYPGYWVRGKKPQYTDATCDMLNINLGINYYLNTIGKSGPYGGIGWSSIYMLKEKYHYQINDPGSDIKRAWYGGGSEDYLSHLDFRVGYNIKLLPWLGFTVNGNYEMPLYGIGHGHVRMSGLGANMGLNLVLK